MFSVLQSAGYKFALYDNELNLKTIRDEKWIAARLKEIEENRTWMRPVLIDEAEND